MARTCNRTCRPWLLIVLLYTVSIVQSATFAPASPEERSSAVVPIQSRTLNYLRRTLKALKGTMEFFQRQYDKVNLDAVIGTRIVEGSVKVLLANLERKRLTGVLPADVVSSIWDIYYVAKRVSDDAEPHVYQSQPRYYQRIGPGIREGLWELNYTQRTMARSVPMWSYRPVEAMTETESDDCLTELFGTTGRTSETCNISELCWRRMTVLGYNRYSLSHQIFYLQIGEQSGCLPQLLWQIVRHGQRGLPHLQDTFCANMLREARVIAADGYPGPQQDLFMEQAALCGMYGYVEFFLYGWLDTILGWQDKTHGCYSWDGWPEERIGEHGHHITKREERRLDNGCLCHRTTVAAGALVQYVRFLVEEYVAETTYSQQV